VTVKLATLVAAAPLKATVATPVKPPLLFGTRL